MKLDPIERTIVVRPPMLEVTSKAPETLVIGRDGVWNFTIENVGDGEARDAIFEQNLPKSLTLVSSQPKATLSGGKLRWDLGNMAPNASRTINYRITVTNQGFATDHDVRIVAPLDEGMSYVQGTGTTQPTVTGETITFAPLAVVEAKAEAAGDKRFKISMTTKALGRPVEETEATNIYE